MIELPARPWRRFIGLVAVLSIGFALLSLVHANDGVRAEATDVQGTPLTIFRPSSGKPGPTVLIAHGFAGSQQLMQPFAITLAREGYTAVTFDFAGHGRNPKSLSGSITKEDGATRSLVDELALVAMRARLLGDGRVAVLGHSMATDIIVRFARDNADVAATIAISMFSPVVTANMPRNLLIVVGEWESGLRRDALRVTGLVSSPSLAEPGVTYGDVSKGTARRMAISPHTEHVGVLYSETSQREALAWLDAVFGRSPNENPQIDNRGLSVLLLLFGVVLLAYPLSSWLPVVSQPIGAGLGWRQMWLPLAVPALATPFILRLIPTDFLPVLVGDYLAVHFALYGILTATCIGVVHRGPQLDRSRASFSRFWQAALAMIAFSLVAITWPIDTYMTSFVPRGSRLVLLFAMLMGTLCYFLADEWLTRGQGAARGGYTASKVLFLASLGLAVALDPQRLFFLIIVVPVIILFFLVYGVFSNLAYRQTGNPFVAGAANAVAFAWAIAVTFPLLSR